MTSRDWSVEETVAVVPGARLVGWPDASSRLNAIALDSRETTDGALFCALPGTRTDGADHAQDALRRGAAAVLAERDISGLDAPLIVVPDARRALAMIAAAWYGAPDRDVTLIGVTGTNGKSTTVRLIATMAQAAGHTAATIGTLGVSLGDDVLPATIARPTTPESHELRQTLNMLRDCGASLVVMEVSSHALALDRTWGLRFAAAVFTNVTPDHLDFHGTLDAYFDAKALLFSGLDDDAVSAVNIDAEHGSRIAEIARGKVLTYGYSTDADVHPIEIEDAPRIAGRIATPNGEVALGMPLVGAFNVENAMAAIAVGIGIGLTPEQIARGLARAEPLPGRFEPVDAGQDFSVIVDYAHTPDALESVLRTARDMTQGRVFCVVGCGGDRDRAKRPVMGEIATRLADATVFTSDNPRTEAPDAILDEIIAAASARNPFERVELRADAIARAIDLAEPADVVIIAGKGHEPYQEIGHTKHPFDDRTEARKAVTQRLARETTPVRQ